MVHASPGSDAHGRQFSLVTRDSGSGATWNIGQSFTALQISPLLLFDLFRLYRSKP